MQNLRKYGAEPFKIAVLHGAPGAPGEMAPVAKELSGSFGILEPLQTATSLEGQLQELYDVLKSNAELPAKLAGWSWGALLSFIFASHYPALIEKLVLISSAVFEEQYASAIMEARLSRLGTEDRPEFNSLIDKLNDPDIKDKDPLLTRLGKIISRIDSYDPLPAGDGLIEGQYEIYQKVSNDAMKLRQSGELLKKGKYIKCPVVAIHGDYDPHPAEGIKNPLSRILTDFKFVLLENCGHHPWLEKNVKNRFYKILIEELS